MAPRKDKNKMIDAAECSGAANKRKRVEFMNDHANPNYSQFQPDNNNNLFGRIFGTDIHLAPPFPLQQEESEFDEFMSWIMPQQSFLINYHINMMQQSVEEFWRRNLAGEINKRKEIETVLRDKEQQAEGFKEMYHFYENRAFELEEIAEQRARGRNAVPGVMHDEEVQSCLVDINSVQRTDVKCKNCRTRPATMLWMPCRHLCVCLVCERRVKACPICNVKKTESFKINLP